MRTLSIVGFFIVCLVEGIAFFYVRDQVSETTRALGIMLPGLVAYFMYLGLIKLIMSNFRLRTSDILTGFIIAVVAVWVPVLLSIVFGWGSDDYPAY